MRQNINIGDRVLIAASQLFDPHCFWEEVIEEEFLRHLNAFKKKKTQLHILSLPRNESGISILVSPIINQPSSSSLDS